MKTEKGIRDEVSISVTPPGVESCGNYGIPLASHSKKLYIEHEFSLLF